MWFLSLCVCVFLLILWKITHFILLELLFSYSAFSSGKHRPQKKANCF
uniref:Uncharacterized protein n=1 Tax=Rhizophora mucronata TaxID=61149 RepID=A0A2P2L5U9_RHIMU